MLTKGWVHFAVMLPEEVLKKYKLAVAQEKISPQFMQAYVRFVFMRLLEIKGGVQLTKFYEAKLQRGVMLTAETADAMLIKSLLQVSEPLNGAASGTPSPQKPLPAEENSAEQNQKEPGETIA